MAEGDLEPGGAQGDVGVGPGVVVRGVLARDHVHKFLSIPPKHSLSDVMQRIKGRIKEQMEKTQKNYYLNEQMRAIKKEMGAEDEASDDLEELEQLIKAKTMSEEATEKVLKEFKKLKLMAPMSAEATVVRNYIDWAISLPWFVSM